MTTTHNFFPTLISHYVLIFITRVFFVDLKLLNLFEILCFLLKLGELKYHVSSKTLMHYHIVCFQLGWTIVNILIQMY